MQKLDPYSIPLESTNLIEASAGTGKSWTVTYLYLRLILEKKLTVDQILVVTFTDAATKELRDDIRNRIVAALYAFEAASTDEGYTEQDEYSELIANSDDYAEAIRQLNRAKLSMDEAAVFTIHSFCQRSLSDNAFEASLPFNSELIEDDSELMQKITDDYWRRNFHQAPRALRFKLQRKQITPDSLLKDVAKHVGKPYLKICGPNSEALKAEKWETLEQLFFDALNSWRSEGEEITQLLTNPEFEKHYFKSLIDNINAVLVEMNGFASVDTLPQQLDTKLMKWLGTEPKLKKSAKCEPIDHPFFHLWQAFMDLWTEIDKKSDDFIHNIRIDLLHHLQQELPIVKQRLGVLSFDDLLLQMQQSLLTYPKLANDLLKKYPAALIDEFQDTDPIQYDIFKAIYHDKNDTQNYDSDKADKPAVFLVGDPKQAIYSFRGGDIHTYLNAKSDTQTHNQHTLKKNWRSHPELVDAFNQLYALCDNPFKDEGISYEQVDYGDRNNNVLLNPNNESSQSSLNFWRFESELEKPSADQIRAQIASSVAGDIAQLLNDGVKGIAKIGDKAISGGDIAILIRSHKHANMIKTALNERGIASVQSSKENIYTTHEANELIYLLKALTSPQNEDEIRRALVTDFMGYNAEDLLAFESDKDTNNRSWEAILIVFQQWHAQWNKRGLLPMLRELMKTQNSYQHLLSFVDGERRVSNVLQLSELIHQVARKQMLGMNETVRWLEKQQRNTSSKETELRLESDEDLVKIVTIHKSKGLEYPIVYCPFIGMSGSAPSDNIFTFYDNETACLEIGSPQCNTHKKLKKADESAEDTRLLYVALTRAKYQCNLVCFPDAISGLPDRSALGWLLTNGLSIPSGNGAAVKKQKAEYYEIYEQNLQTLSESQSSISLCKMPEYGDSLRFHAEQSESVLSAREFTATIRSQAQITSFSGLTSGAHDEAPDYDASAKNQILAKAEENEFPRGPTAGTALHEIFENIDFEVAVIEQTDIVSAVLDKYGFDESHQTSAIQLIQQSLDATLTTKEQTTFSLNALSKSQRLDEMEFYLPLERLRIDDLKQILFHYLPKELPKDRSVHSEVNSERNDSDVIGYFNAVNEDSDDSDNSEDNKNSHEMQNWQLIRDAVNGLYFEEVEGFLKGYIDLIFEQDGQYYLADYKSNSLNSYDDTALFEAMAHSHYYLQYLFYSVALHRYLKQRIDDYNWDTHIGGAYYLFIRGMKFDVDTTVSKNSTDTIESTSTDKEIANSLKKVGGVFFDKPSLELIEALDGLFVNLGVNLGTTG